jgi:hypothetical protein
LRSLIRDRNIGQIDICGLAGDICVLNTLRDGIKIYGAKDIPCLKRIAPSLDGGASLEKRYRLFWVKRQGIILSLTPKDYRDSG